MDKKRIKLGNRHTNAKQDRQDRKKVKTDRRTEGKRKEEDGSNTSGRQVHVWNRYRYSMVLYGTVWY